MSNIKDGGPAFPSGLIDPSTPEDAVHSLHSGLSIRDYFAAKAMQGLMNTEYRLTDASYNAKQSYAIADAMLAAREAK
jgi:hypothetical protein